MFTGQLSMSDVGGPIMVVAKGSEIAQADFSKLFHFTILISIELVILNLLPLPAVDGGHLFLLIIEKIRGRRLPREFEERIHYTGLMLLLGLGVFLIFKDVLTISHIIR
jgi:RIP metalloprotease RseP